MTAPLTGQVDCQVIYYCMYIISNDSYEVYSRLTAAHLHPFVICKMLGNVRILLWRAEIHNINYRIPYLNDFIFMLKMFFFFSYLIFSYFVQKVCTSGRIFYFFVVLKMTWHLLILTVE